MCDNDQSFDSYATFVVRRSEGTGELMVISRYHHHVGEPATPQVAYGVAGPEVDLSAESAELLAHLLEAEMRSWLF